MIPRALWLACVTAALLVLCHASAGGPRRWRWQGSSVVAIPASEAQTQVTYAVADLVSGTSPANLEVAPLPGGLQKIALEDRVQDSVKARPAVVLNAPEAPFLKHILATVAPASWQSAGGSGTLRYLPESQELVVSQTSSVHEELAAALAALRKKQEIVVVLDCRMIQIPVKKQNEGSEQKTRQLETQKIELPCHPPIDLASQWVLPATGKSSMEFLNEEQRQRFLDMVAAEPNGKIIQRAVTSCATGQNVAIERIEYGFYLVGFETVAAGNQKFFSPNNAPIANGLRLALRPVVSGDQRFVRLGMNGYWSQLNGPVPLIPIQMPIEGVNGDGTPAAEPAMFQMFLQQPTFGQIRFNQQVNIPDGGTVLIDGGILRCEVKQIDWSDWTTWLALVTGDDPNSSTWEDHHIFLMVSARVNSPASDKELFLSSPAH